MKKAVIFDLDGTLLDSVQSLKYCVDQAVKPLGMGPFSVEQYYYFVGDGAANLIRRALIAGGDTELVHFEETFFRFRDIFWENCMYQVAPYEEIPELLAALKERGLRLAVFSNKLHEETVRVVESLFGRGCFDIVRGQQEGAALKPNPEGVFKIVEELGLQPEDILYLGDTSTDMQTGKAAGVMTVGVLWGFRDREELEQNHADIVVTHPMEVLELLG